MESEVYASCHFAEGMQTAYDQTATMLMFCQALAILEIVNAAFGLTKGGVVPPLLQVRHQ